VKLLRRNSLERRLFGWLLAAALVPMAVLLVFGTWVWSGALDRMIGAGPWVELAESGRAVFEAAESAAAVDPELARALERHREELSTSLVLARRWAFVGERVVAVLPVAALVLGLALAGLILSASRHLARQLARPIRDLVQWTGLVAREEPLPPPGPRERREVREIQVLRSAFRQAAEEISGSRRRAVEAERLRVWGEMARRVAHEMKNPLTPLRLAAHRLERLIGDVPEAREPLAVLREETGRLERMAQQFSALGRPPAGPRSPVDIRELIAGLLASDVPAGIETSLEADPDLPLLEGYYEALVRTFRNLILNAVEALARGGRGGHITVEVRRVAGERPDVPDAVAVSVLDDGPGLPPDVGERIFEPDFTTKSGGTGLGLALVRQAVAAHGGEVRARNRPHGGAEFYVRLPVAAAEVEV